MFKRSMGVSLRNSALPLLLVSMPLIVHSADQKLKFTASAGIEFDDNVSVSTIDQSTGQSDKALVVDFSASYMAVESEGRELELAYDFYQSIYSDLTDFNLQIHTLSALGSWDFETYDTGLNYNFSHTSLGGDRLFDSHTLTPYIGFGGVSDAWYHRVSYGYVNKDFFTNSDRDAAQHSVAVDNYYFFNENKSYISLGLRYEDENTSGPEFDYQGTYINLGASLPVQVGKWTPALKANYKHYWRDYDNVTASIGERRDDEQDAVTLELSHPLSKSVSAKLNYEWNDTDSNLASADFEENIVSLVFSADF